MSEAKCACGSECKAGEIIYCEFCKTIWVGVEKITGRTTEQIFEKYYTGWNVVTLDEKWNSNNNGKIVNQE